jgi:hypothetical protein
MGRITPIILNLCHGIEESIKHDVELLRTNPSIKPGTRFIGLAYDNFIGLLTEAQDETRSA